MSSISNINPSITKKEYLDFARPSFMETADQLLGKLQSKYGKKTTDTFEILVDVAKVITDTKGSTLKDFWTNFEKQLNRKKTISIDATKDIEHLQTAFSLFYSALDEFDKAGALGNEVASLQSIYIQTRDHVAKKFFSGDLSSIEKNMITRAINTTNNRFKKVISHYNERIEKSQIPGPEITSRV